MEMTYLEAIRTALREPSRAAHFSPMVMKLAAQYGVDLGKVSGTGINGRVRKQDVLAYVAGRQEERQPSVISHEPSEEEEVLPITTQRRLIAERMVRSKQVSPHVTTVLMVDMTRIVRWREKNEEELLAKEGIKITYLPFILRATVKALQAFPTLNSRWEERGIVVVKRIHLGIAVRWWSMTPLRFVR